MKFLIRSALIPASVLGLAAILGCRMEISNEEARRLVERYNQVVCEAYRRCDVKLIDSVVGPNTVDGRRLAGLIGVRLDTGISLDAELLALEVAGVNQDGDGFRVRTREQWHYRDLKIGTGEQVGEESTDSYEMLYVFAEFDGRWMVAETSFSAPPQVGRKTTPWAAGHEVLHGVIGPSTGKDDRQP